MKMGQSVPKYIKYKIQTSGNYPEENIQQEENHFFVQHFPIHYTVLPFILSITAALLDRKPTGARTSCDMLCYIMIKGTQSGVCI